MIRLSEIDGYPVEIYRWSLKGDDYEVEVDTCVGRKIQQLTQAGLRLKMLTKDFDNARHINRMIDEQATVYLCG